MHNEELAFFVKEIVGSKKRNVEHQYHGCFREHRDSQQLAKKYERVGQWCEAKSSGHTRSRFTTPKVASSIQHSLFSSKAQSTRRCSKKR